MRRLSMKNKRRKSEAASDSESEKNGGARATDNDETDDAHVTRKSASKRRSSRGAPVQKSATGDENFDDVDIIDDPLTAEKEQTNGEKKPSSNKRRKKDDPKASTSARDDSPNSNEYEVEELINLRTIKGRRQFLVRWKGYGESADTWENEKDLSCPALIKEYLAKEREKDIKLAKTGSAKADKSKKSKANFSLPKKQAENAENNKDEKEGLKEFEVEKIVEVHFKKNGTREFLIRWKGFGPTDDTWEPEKNLNCPDLIDKFMQKVEKAKTTEVRELRTNRVHTKRYTLSTQDSGRRLSKRNKDKQRATYHECD